MASCPPPSWHQVGAESVVRNLALTGLRLAGQSPGAAVAPAGGGAALGSSSSSSSRSAGSTAPVYGLGPSPRVQPLLQQLTAFMEQVGGGWGGLGSGEDQAGRYADKQACMEHRVLRRPELPFPGCLQHVYLAEEELNRHAHSEQVRQRLCAGRASRLPWCFRRLRHAMDTVAPALLSAACSQSQRWTIHPLQERLKELAKQQGL